MALFPMSVGMAVAQDADQYPTQQNGAPPPPPEDQQQSSYEPLGPDQLDQLVAPIALYPDSLVAQVLAGATYPAQVASAEQFVQQSGNYPAQQLAEMANTQPWDPSVKSLVAFPQVLSNMNQNMDWTTQLGNAYYNQPQDVLGAVQTMRQRAYAAGSLRSTPQLNVEDEPGSIVIAPVSPAVVYVPYYNPWVVYGAPLPVYPRYYYGPPAGIAFGAGLALGFGVGIAVGAFAGFSWGCHNWGPNWGSRTVVFNHNTYISHSVTVINHGNYGGYDRNAQARAFNQQQSVQPGGVHSTTINNVTVNRGGNSYSRSGSTFNNGGSAYSHGGATFNRSANTYAQGATNASAGGFYPGGQRYNAASHGQAAPNAKFSQGGQTGQAGQFNQFRRGYAGGAAPQATPYRGGTQAYARPQAPPQAHAPQVRAPQQQRSQPGHGDQSSRRDARR